MYQSVTLVDRYKAVTDKQLGSALPREVVILRA